MSLHLNVNEIIDFAIYIEKNGYEFYTDTAKKFTDLKIVQLFNRLAEEELKHEKTFRELKNKVNEIPPAHESYEGEYIGYMKDYLKSHTLKENKEIKKKVASLTSIEEAISLAIDFEKDSVVFYSGFKKYLGKQNENLVENIIQEELSHISTLLNIKTEFEDENAI